MGATNVSIPREHWSDPNPGGKSDGSDFGPGGFWESDNKGAVVRAFKRMKVACTVDWANEKQPIRIIRNVRSALIFGRAPGKGPNAKMLAQTLVKTLQRRRTPVGR